LLAHATRGGAIFGHVRWRNLVAREVCNPTQPSLALADITVIRTATDANRQRGAPRTTTLSPAHRDGFHSRPDHRTHGTSGEILATPAGNQSSCAKAKSNRDFPSRTHRRHNRTPVFSAPGSPRQTYREPRAQKFHTASRLCQLSPAESVSFCFHGAPSGKS